MSLVGIENIALAEEPFEMQDPMSETVAPEADRLTNLMNELGVSKEVQFILLKQRKVIACIRLPEC